MKNNRNPLPVDPTGGELKGIRGEIVTFINDPFLNNVDECYIHYLDGLIVIQDGIIIDVDEFKNIEGKYPLLKDIDH